MKRASGFTLLEVMGAVLILGLLGTSLMTATLESTRRAGQARDLLVASLLADSALADVEAAPSTGEIRPGRQEREVEGYRITVETQPADAAALGLRPISERPRGEAPATVLTAGRGARASLYIVHIEVSGPDGPLAERTTFLFDPAAVPELQDLAAKQAVPDA